MIIALAQTGIGDAEVNELEENAAYDLTKVEGSDAIISGHSHYAFPGNDRNLPEVDLEKKKRNGWLKILSQNYEQFMIKQRKEA